jgi:predicted ATPase/DNA-binding winged helix-turn-helix (wHTH) protein
MPVADKVSFGPFELSVRRRTLVRAGEPVPLSSRAFDVLLALLDACDEPIGKEDLIRRVWGRLVVEENNLHVQIAAVRRALGPENPFILTIPARGYRFVGDVHWESETGAAWHPAPEAPAGNLPVQVTPIIGRQQELQDLSEMLGRARLATLVGPGGVGKTRLALAAAPLASGDYPDGRWLVELGSLADPALAVSALAACLRIEEIQDRPLIESVVAALRPRAMLLVIDSCEHVLAAAASLVSELIRHCPRLKLLCTSQSPLGVDGEHVRRIAPFDVDVALEAGSVEEALAQDAVRLFTERAGAGDGRFVLNEATVAGVIEICRNLEGIPLAIELAAARVPLLGLEPVRQRIANRLALLGADLRDKPDRHRTLRATIEWSHSLLPEAGRGLLRRLSIFAGGFTLDAAQAVAAGSAIEEWDVVRGVGDLVQRSLLTTGPDLVRPRHRMLEAMREFGLNALEAAGEHQPIARRHAEFYKGLAEAAEARWETSGDLDWPGDLTQELENLRAGLKWALGSVGDASLGADLAAATARFWFEAGQFSEGRTWLARALEQAPSSLEVATRVRLKRGLAELSMNPLAAETAAQEALALARTLDHPPTEGVCLRTLAATLYRLGRYDEAEAATRRSFETLDEASCPRTYAKALGDLCILHATAGNYAEARRLNAEAQARLKSLGDRRSAAICLQHAAELEFVAGDVGAAEAMGRESVALFRALDSRFRLEIGLGNLAAYRAAADDVSGAATAAREGLTMAEALEDQEGIVNMMEILALACAKTGGFETAARLQAFTAKARGEQGLKPQQTEQAISDRLSATLAATLEPQARARLSREGAALDQKTAVRMALAPGEPAASDGPRLLAASRSLGQLDGHFGREAGAQG